MLNEADTAADAHRRHARLLPLAQLRDGEGDGEGDARVDVAMALSLIFGWRFFQPFITAAMNLDQVDGAELHATIRARMRTLAGLG